jgi:hypothetical protein
MTVCLSQKIVNLSRNRINLSQNILSLSHNAVSLSQTNGLLSQNILGLTQNLFELAQTKGTLSQVISLLSRHRGRRRRAERIGRGRRVLLSQNEVLSPCHWEPAEWRNSRSRECFSTSGWKKRRGRET